LLPWPAFCDKVERHDGRRQVALSTESGRRMRISGGWLGGIVVTDNKSSSPTDGSHQQPSVAAHASFPWPAFAKFASSIRMCADFRKRRSCGGTSNRKTYWPGMRRGCHDSNFSFLCEDISDLHRAQQKEVDGAKTVSSKRSSPLALRLFVEVAPEN
jgi:hypothetical protein